MRIVLFLFYILFAFACEAQPSIYAVNNAQRKSDHPTLELLLDHNIGVVIAGQSNSYGTNASTPSTTPVDLTAPITDVFIRLSENNWATLDYPTNDKGEVVGSNLSMGYYLRQEFNRPVYMDVVGVSGAPVAAEAAQQDFNVSTRELYVNLLVSFLDVEEKIIAEDRDPFLILVWIQGEKDTGTSSFANAYDDNLSDVINSLIADGVPLKAVIVNTLNDNLDTNPALLSVVQTKQREYIQRTPIAWQLDMNAYTLGADDIHYDGPAQEQIGIDVVNMLNGTIITEVENVDISFAEVLANMNTAPAAAYETAMEDFYDGLVADGIWDDILEIQCRALDTEANSLRGWKGFFNATNTGTATWVAKSGFNYDGTADFVNTGFIATNAPRGVWGKFDAGIAVYCKDNQTATGIRALAGNQDAGGDRISLFQNANITYRIACSGSTTSTAETSFADNSLYSIYRTASNSQQLWKNGVFVNSGNPVTTDRPDVAMYEGALNVTGTASNFFDGILTITIWYKGTTMDQADLNTRVQAFVTALAAIP